MSVIFSVLGHDFMPMLFTHDDNGNLTFIAKMDAAVKKEEETVSAMAKFRSMDKHALGHKESKSLTTHMNAIRYDKFSFCDWVS